MTSQRIKERELLKEKRIRKVMRVRMGLRILALFLIAGIPLFFMTTASASRQEASVYLKLKDVAIVQGEEVPEFETEVEVVGNTEIILNEKTGYTVKDLEGEFKKGNGYTVACDADTGVEGEYSMHLELNDRIKKSLKKEWFGLLSIDTLDAAFQVKNPLGEWDGDRIRRYDGTYVKNEFVVSKGKTYYFGEDEKMATGWQNAGGADYFLDSEGVLKTGWLDQEDSRYYLEADGRMVTGWKDIEGKTYYFSQDGKMMTGETFLGMTKCNFGKDGVLTSMEESGVDPNKPMLALTFDDGPGQRTGELLEGLSKYGAHATFFMQGKNVNAYKEEVKRMKEVGCEIGSHSYDHPDLTKMDAAGIKDQVDRTDQNIHDIIGQGATVLRPPYGAINDTVKATIRKPLILWNIDTLDWKTRNAQMTVNEVLTKAKDGDIILMHDIHSETVDAAIELIPKLIAQGYQLVTVSEMAAAKGIKMENGERYTDF